MNIDHGSVATAAKNLAYVGGGTAIYGGWTANELAAFGGLALAGLTFVVNLYFRHKDNARNQRLYEAQMASLPPRRDDIE